jgi:hypothetical protein
MPAVLKAMPNVGSPEEQRRVRMEEGMPIILSGPGATLADLLPRDVTRDSSGHVTAPLQLLLHLLLPVVLISGFAEDLSIAGYMVGPGRLGVALDIILRVYHAAQARVVSLSLSLIFITRVAPHCVNTLMILHAAHTRMMSAG